MALEDVQRAYVRSEIGTAEPPSDDDLDDSFALFGAVSSVILDVLRTRRAALVSGGALMFSVVGFYFEDARANIVALDAQIARIAGSATAIDEGDFGEHAFGMARLVRPGWSRRSGRGWAESSRLA